MEPSSSGSERSNALKSSKVLDEMMDIGTSTNDVDNDKSVPREDNLDQSTTIVQLPLEIVSNILSYLNPRSLVTCRNVNSYWRSEASKVLRTQRTNSTTILIAFYRQQDSTKPTKLERFLNCLKMTMTRFGCLTDFPCPQIKLYEYRLDKTIVQEFLNLYGPFITRLDLVQCKSRIGSSSGHGEEIHSLGRLLLEQAQNVQHLSVYCHNFIDKAYRKVRANQLPPVFPRKNATDGEEASTKLCKLKSFKCGARLSTDKKIMREILTAAVHLDSFDVKYGYQPAKLPLSLLWKLNKINTIKSISFVMMTSRRFPYYEKLTRMGPKLNHLMLHSTRDYGSSDGSRNSLNRLRMCIIIMKILLSSAETLETIHDFQSLGLMKPPFGLPRLEKLKKIFVNDAYYDDDDGKEKYKVFSPATKLAWSFPNLKDIVIHLDNDYVSPRNDEDGGESPFWSTILPSMNMEENRLTSVQHLQINQLPIDSHKTVMDWLPNLKELTIDFSDMYKSAELFPFCNGIWKYMQGLRGLEFRHLKSIRDLVVAWKIDDAGTPWEKFQRKNVSILDLIELRSLVLTFNEKALAPASNISCHQDKDHQRLVDILVNLKSLQYLAIKGIQLSEHRTTTLKEALGPFVHIECIAKYTNPDNMWLQDDDDDDVDDDDDDMSLGSYDDDSTEWSSTDDEEVTDDDLFFFGSDDDDDD